MARFIAVLPAVLLLAGCLNGSSPPVPNQPGTQSKFVVYVSDETDGALVAYAYDAVSGSITQLSSASRAPSAKPFVTVTPGTPIEAGCAANALTVSADQLAALCLNTPPYAALLNLSPATGAVTSVAPQTCLLDGGVSDMDSTTIGGSMFVAVTNDVLNEIQVCRAGPSGFGAPVTTSLGALRPFAFRFVPPPAGSSIAQYLTVSINNANSLLIYPFSAAGLGAPLAPLTLTSGISSLAPGSGGTAPALYGAGPQLTFLAPFSASGSLNVTPFANPFNATAPGPSLPRTTAFLGPQAPVFIVGSNRQWWEFDQIGVQRSNGTFPFNVTAMASADNGNGTSAFFSIGPGTAPNTSFLGGYKVDQSTFLVTPYPVVTLPYIAQGVFAGKH